MKACQLEVIAGLVSGGDVFVIWWALNKLAVWAGNCVTDCVTTTFQWHKSMIRGSPDPFPILRVGSGYARLLCARISLMTCVVRVRITCRLPEGAGGTTRWRHTRYADLGMQSITAESVHVHLYTFRFLINLRILGAGDSTGKEGMEAMRVHQHTKLQL